MKKVYKRLTPSQRARGVVFSSCLSTQREELEGDTIHEVFESELGDKQREKMLRLKDDRFFNQSHFKFNIIRKVRM